MISSIIAQYCPFIDHFLKIWAPSRCAAHGVVLVTPDVHPVLSADPLSADAGLILDARTVLQIATEAVVVDGTEFGLMFETHFLDSSC